MLKPRTSVRSFSDKSSVASEKYCARYDMDKDAAVEARKRILQYAADNSLTLLGMHFPPSTKE